MVSTFLKTIRDSKRYQWGQTDEDSLCGEKPSLKHDVTTVRKKFRVEKFSWRQIFECLRAEKIFLGVEVNWASRKYFGTTKL